MRYWMPVVVAAVVSAVVALVWTVVLLVRRPEPPIAPVAPGSPSASPPPVLVGEIAHDDGFEFVVAAVECGADVVGSGSASKTSAQGVFCLVRLRVTNIGTPARGLRADDQRAYAGATRFVGDAQASRYANAPALFGAPIEPGASTSTVVVFEIPRETQLTSLELHESSGSPGIRVALQPVR